MAVRSLCSSDDCAYHLLLQTDISADAYAGGYSGWSIQLYLDYFLGNTGHLSVQYSVCDYQSARRQQDAGYLFGDVVCS